MENFDALIQSFSRLKVGVIGDVMLDTYIWGHVDRISPEAPVPVVILQNKEYRIGGAGNVALNCAALGAQTYIISIAGNDTEGQQLKELFKKNNIDTSYLLQSNDRITTSKTRIISRNQHMMRLDAEVITDINEADEKRVIDNVEKFINKYKPDVIIFEDYNKGLLTGKIITQIIELCVQSGTVTAVDPKRKNFFQYKQVTLFKPNLKEVKEALNLLNEEIDKGLLQKIHFEIAEKLDHAISFITLSEKGVYYQQQEVGEIVPSHIRNIADVSGAGDTVIAVASMVYAITKNARLMAAVANIAGGLVCEEVGTVAINKERLLQECKTLLG